jgi:hypothetical protein
MGTRTDTRCTGIKVQRVKSMVLEQDFRPFISIKFLYIFFLIAVILV